MVEFCLWYGFSLILAIVISATLKTEIPFWVVVIGWCIFSIIF